MVSDISSMDRILERLGEAFVALLVEFQVPSDKSCESYRADMYTWVYSLKQTTVQLKFKRRRLCVLQWLFF